MQSDAGLAAGLKAEIATDITAQCWRALCGADEVGGGRDRSRGEMETDAGVLP